MRKILCTALAAAALAGCATNPEPPQRSLAAQQELDKLLAGKVQSESRSCLPAFSRNDMRVIDDRTILFRESANRVWRTEAIGGCSPLGRPGYAMVTRTYGGSGLCRGEIVQILDTSLGSIVGSCSLGDFTLYTGQRRR